VFGDGVAVVVVVGVEVVFGGEVPLLEDDDRVVLGTITVTVTLGVVFVVFVPDLVVVVVPDLVVVVVPDLVVVVAPDLVVLVVPDVVGVVSELVVVVVPELGFGGELPGVVPGWNAAYCTIPAGAE
jgi:hypothetical protein